MNSFPYIWFWRGSQWRPVYRKGERCRVLVRARMNTALAAYKEARGKGD